MNQITLTKDQQLRIISLSSEIEQFSRTVSSPFIKGIFDFIIENKLISFVIFSTSNKLTDTITADLYNLYSWLFASSKEKFKDEDTGNRILYVAEKVYSFLTIVDPKKFPKVNLITPKGSWSDNPRNTNTSFKENDVISYGSTYYKIFSDNGSQIYLTSIDKNFRIKDKNLSPTIVNSTDTMRDIRRNCHIFIPAKVENEKLEELIYQGPERDWELFLERQKINLKEASWPVKEKEEKKELVSTTPSSTEVFIRNSLLDRNTPIENQSFRDGHVIGRTSNNILLIPEGGVIEVQNRVGTWNYDSVVVYDSVAYIRFFNSVTNQYLYATLFYISRQLITSSYSRILRHVTNELNQIAELV